MSSTFFLSINKINLNNPINPVVQIINESEQDSKDSKEWSQYNLSFMELSKSLAQSLSKLNNPDKRCRKIEKLLLDQL